MLAASLGALGYPVDQLTPGDLLALSRVDALVLNTGTAASVDLYQLSESIPYPWVLRGLYVDHFQASGAAPVAGALIDLRVTDVPANGVGAYQASEPLLSHLGGTGEFSGGRGGFIGPLWIVVPQPGRRVIARFRGPAGMDTWGGCVIVLYTPIPEGIARFYEFHG